MTAGLFKQTLQLAFDKELHSYWVSRALIASLYFLFGILLRNTGASNAEVILAWIAVGASQGALLLALDRISKRFNPIVHYRIAQILCLLALASTIAMTFIGLDLVWFSVCAIVMMPLIRELTHAGIIHIRDRKDWALGNNVAFLYANESSKGLGALFIMLFGFFSSIGSETVALFLCGLLLVCLLQSIWKKPEHENNTFDPSARIGAHGRRYVLISFVQNGAFSSSKSILSLVLFDLLVNAGSVENVILFIAAGLSIAMIIGIVAMQALNGRIHSLLKQLPRVSLLTLSIAGQGVLIAIGFAMTAMGAYTEANPIVLGHVIAVSIAGLMAIGGLFSLGTMKHLDKAFSHNLKLRKSTLHYCWIGGSFAPSLFMAGYLLMEWLLPSLEAAAVILTVSILFELWVVAFSHRASLALNESRAKEIAHVQTT